jgi:hypothetical protein
VQNGRPAAPGPEGGETRSVLPQDDVTRQLPQRIGLRAEDVECVEGEAFLEGNAPE